MRYEDEWVSRTPIVRPPVGVQLLVPAAAEFLATEGDLEAIFSLGFVTSAAESAAVSTNATTLRRLVGCTRARMQGRHGWDLRGALTDAAVEERSLKEVCSVVIWRTCAHSVSWSSGYLC